MRTVIERHGIPHCAQHGFLTGKSTATAAMTLLNAAEEACRYKQDLHVLCLDIRKAYDTVVRTIGVEGAMRRLGIPLEIVELMMECERNSLNDVRTHWDPLMDAEAFLFEAQRGFVQGAAVSPLLWLIFYDMVLVELEHQGVGAGRSADTGHHVATGGGVVTFADDTTLLTNSVEELAADAETTLLTLDAVCLQVAAQKSVHIPLVWKDNEMALMEDRVAVDPGVQLRMRGVAVPFAEADVGTRFLGFHMDLRGDYGEQQAKLEEIIDDFGQRIGRARISKGIVAYLVEAVLIPRVMYPMSVAPFTPKQIQTLESRALRWILPKVGLTPSFSRDLLRSSMEWGGFGWDAWTSRVATIKSELASDMANHPDPVVRGSWMSMRARYEDEKTFMTPPFFGGASGDALAEVETAVQATWLQTFEALLSVSGMAWDDGAAPPPAPGR